MIIPQTVPYEFVNSTIFNNAFGILAGSIQEELSNDIFFIPGLINQSFLVFSFNNTLTVTLTMTNSGVNAFKTLFQTGAISGAFGTTNGTSTNVYTVNLAPFVPGVGSQVVYIVAQFTQIQQSPQTILGPPSGHPDYSPGFVPTIGYTQLVNSLNITATTTVPDNQVTMELARVTLTAGQTVVTAVNTANQVQARVNALYVTMVGDVTGPSNNNIISNLQGNPVKASSPSVNQFLMWNGIDWVPMTITPTGQYCSVHLVGKKSAGNPLTQFAIDVDFASLRQPSNNALMYVTNFSDFCTVVGSQTGPTVNGRDQAAAFPANSFYHIYLIGGINQTPGLIASAISPPNGPILPTNYTYWAYLGTFLLSNSGNILPMYVNGNTISYSLAQNVVFGNAHAGQTSASTSAFVPTVAQSVQLTLGVSSPLGTAVSFGPDSNTTFNTYTNPATWYATVFDQVGMTVEMPNTQLVYYASDPTSPAQAFIWVLGYTVPNNAS